jgi:hypothetical protein
MNKHTNGMIVYIIITFGMAWGIWGIALLSGLRPADGLVFQAAIFPGIFAPAVAAVIVRRWVTQEGFTSARLRPNLHRWKPYLLAWFLPLIVIAVVVLFAYGFNLSLPDYSLQRGYVEHTGAQAPEGFRFCTSCCWLCGCAIDGASDAGRRVRLARLLAAAPVAQAATVRCTADWPDLGAVGICRCTWPGIIFMDQPPFFPPSPPDNLLRAAVNPIRLAAATR